MQSEIGGLTSCGILMFVDGNLTLFKNLGSDFHFDFPLLFVSKRKKRTEEKWISFEHKQAHLAKSRILGAEERQRHTIVQKNSFANAMIQSARCALRIVMSSWLIFLQLEMSQAVRLLLITAIRWFALSCVTFSDNQIVFISRAPLALANDLNSIFCIFQLMKSAMCQKEIVLKKTVFHSSMF